MADLSLLLLSILWGTTFTFVKEALAGTSPPIFLTLRFAVATASMGVLWWLRRDARSPRLLVEGGLLGLAMLGGFALQTFGLALTTPARSGFLTGLAVLLVPVVQRFLLGRRVGVSAWLGVAVSLAGLLLLTQPFGGDVPEEVRLGDLLTVGCAACFALQVVYTAEWSARHPLVPLTFVQIAVTALGSALLVPAAPLAIAPSPALAAVVVFTGLVMTAGAFGLQNWAQRHTTAVRAAILFAVEPVAAALFAWLWTGQPLAAHEWLGGSLIVAAVLLAEVGGLLEAQRGSRGARRA